MPTPGIKAYREIQKILVTASTDPSKKAERDALRTRLREITMKLTPFELRLASLAPPPRSRCCD